MEHIGVSTSADQSPPRYTACHTPSNDRLVIATERMSKAGACLQRGGVQPERDGVAAAQQPGEGLEAAPGPQLLGGVPQAAHHEGREVALLAHALQQLLLHLGVEAAGGDVRRDGGPLGAGAPGLQQT
jgi:hypothetical protein